MAAYTASMHQSHHSPKHFFLSAGIALTAFLISGCCAPGTYYDQPVTYVPQASSYLPTYSYPSYPIYQQVVVPAPSPRYAWNSLCPPPPPCHRDAIYPRQCSWRDSRATYDHHREEHRAPSWGQRQQYASRPAPEGSFPPRSELPPRSAAPPRQAPPPPAPVTTFQQQPSLANNQDPSTR